MTTNETYQTNPRQQRGLIIAATCKLANKGDFWVVPSQSGHGKYYVRPNREKPSCTCPDHQEEGHKCKHIFAVELVIQRELFPDGSVRETRQVTLSEIVVRKPTYRQDWPAYNAAQVNEKDKFQSLLVDLLRGVPEPSQKPKRGNQPLKIRDAMFAAVFKVYSTVSGRRFMSDLRDAKGKGHVEHAACYNSIFKVLESPAATPILLAMIQASAAPLKAIESGFACDSSGFSTCRFDRWYDAKYGAEKSRRAWVKCHLMCGVKTNVVTAVEISDAADCPTLPALVKATRQVFSVKEVYADMAYISEDNLATIMEGGAEALIPFKSNATGAKGGLWAKMFHYFNLNREEFLKRYHQRSNVESTFSMVKAKFGDSVRSKTDTAMKNEVLAKILCHNVCCLISAMYELGIDPVFWAQAG